MLPLADKLRESAVIVPDERVIALAEVKLMVPVAVKLELTAISLPAPVVVRLMFAAVMPAPAVVRVPPAVRSNRLVAVDAPRVRPEASVMKALVPVVLADRLVTSVNM